MGGKEKLRLLVIFGMVLVFSGFLLLSVLTVRHNVSGIEKDEFYLIERGTTGSLQREPDGNLIDISVPADTDVTVEETPREEPKFCPT